MGTCSIECEIFLNSVFFFFFIFCQKNVFEGLRIFEHMRRANVKPNLQTLIYLISNSKNVEDTDKVNWL